MVLTFSCGFRGFAIVDVFVIEKLMRCLGINSIFRGFAIIVWPPIARNLYEATFSFDIPFTGNFSEKII